MRLVTSGVACGLLPGAGGEGSGECLRGCGWGRATATDSGPAWILCELTKHGPSVSLSLCIWETAAIKIVNAVSTTHLVACWGLGAIV